MELREPVVLMPRETSKRRTREGQSTDAAHWGGVARSSDEAAVIAVERQGLRQMGMQRGTTAQQEDAVIGAKPFSISKQQVMEAYRRVKSNAGAAGVDQQSLVDFEADLKNNLYRLWNRLSSGSYFPPPVKGVWIPKKAGGQRLLGVPTVADRVVAAATMLAIATATGRHQMRYGALPRRLLAGRSRPLRGPRTVTSFRFTPVSHRSDVGQDRDRSHVDRGIMRSPTGAMNYVLRHYEALTLFLSVPGAPIDNNRAERLLKLVVRSRKNSGHFKSGIGAENLPCLRRNKVSPSDTWKPTIL